MFHHLAKGIHHSARHTHKLINHLGAYYSRNPGKIIEHGSTVAQVTGHVAKGTVKHAPKAIAFTGRIAAKSSVKIGKMAWTHGPKVAKHTAKFMVKSALKGFKLFST